MKKVEKNFIVSQEDWTLHRKGYQDQQRHKEKIKESIKNNLPDIISEENIIMSNGKDVIKIPIRSLDEYKIRYNHDNKQHVGSGDGESEVGDVIAKDGSGKGQSGAGKGEGAGNAPGEDYYEAEVSLAELEEVLFEELELPRLIQKDQIDMTMEDIEFNDLRKQGLMGNLDKKRTILTALKRNARAGKPVISPIHNDDLRFKTWNEKEKPESSAVVLAMMDTSGSMGRMQKYLARSFFFWMTRFLRSKYETVEIEFIAHHTEARVVTEEEFFSKGESGGTICSSAYMKALELIDEKYPPTSYNIYPFHLSDGDNFSTDNKRCLELLQELLDVSNMFGYGEVNLFDRYSTLMGAFKSINHPRFHSYIMRKNRDVYEALKSFFKKEEVTV
ncbi:MAG TPA: sporulation protein YhbH [Candidatus Avamphibacillus sp.]|nr:sporulation protein YhbH [Candidatus Avamphibacillus sp.]